MSWWRLKGGALLGRRALNRGVRLIRFPLKQSREEKSLRHVAMVAKMLHDNKPKIQEFAPFQTSLILSSFI